jgi:hypothetical protein
LSVSSYNLYGLSFILESIEPLAAEYPTLYLFDPSYYGEITVSLRRCCDFEYTFNYFVIFTFSNSTGNGSDEICVGDVTVT